MTRFESGEHVITTLEELREEKAARMETLERELESVKNQLVAMGALKLVLFGSFARGKAGRASDLDIIAVMPPSKRGRGCGFSANGATGSACC